MSGGAVSPRFGGVARLFSEPEALRLSRSHAAVIGLGGVGSWAAEALARTGVGRMTLIDLDDVCETNINRQIHALSETVGQPKGEVLARRLSAINPQGRFEVVHSFFNRHTAEGLLEQGYDVVLDAIDGVGSKAWLIGSCVTKGIPVVTCGGAGGRGDPRMIETVDLAWTRDDPLLAFVRKKLRRWFDFPGDLRTPFGVPCVYSREPIVWPAGCEVEPSDDPFASAPARGCDSGLGAVAYVTGTFGFFAAHAMVETLLGEGGTVVYGKPWKKGVEG
ncbi:MAG TPA: tRNA threonylcarbamoyladenosine dehydratase [Kiritimatiellia bacterium]|nr:tRNA threonylcarbamoyladenosine dehydratase [Kiritimatiellia bacterium]